MLIFPFYMDASTDGIRVYSNPTLRDYRHFLKWVAFRQVRLLVPFALLSLICFLLAPFIPFEEQGALARYSACIPAIILPAIIFGFMPIRIYIVARKVWNSAAELRSSRTYGFGDNAIDIAADTFSSQVNWQRVVTARKTRGLIVLGTGQKLFYLVPTSDFESQEQFQSFCELVKSKVPDSRI